MLLCYLVKGSSSWLLPWVPKPPWSWSRCRVWGGSQVSPLFGLDMHPILPRVLRRPPSPLLCNVTLVINQAHVQAVCFWILFSDPSAYLSLFALTYCIRDNSPHPVVKVPPLWSSPRWPWLLLVTNQLAIFYKILLECWSQMHFWLYRKKKWKKSKSYHTVSSTSCTWFISAFS